MAWMSARASSAASPNRAHTDPFEMACKRLLLVMLWTLAWYPFPAATCRGTDLCGHPLAGHVEIVRDDAPIGRFVVALAETVPQRRQGLMHCPRLEPGTGMLFTYADAKKRVFWMKDTPVELAIVFIGDDGRIAAVAHGLPGSLERIHSPDRIARVLEVGWAEGRNLAIGDRVAWVPAD